MSDAPLTTPSSMTPRSNSDINNININNTSSVESPRSLLDQSTPTMNLSTLQSSANGLPKVSFTTASPLSGGLTLGGGVGAGGVSGLIFDESSFRRQSPESDGAVTSSDDEEHKLGVYQKGGISQLSSRRPSYAAEFHTRQRAYSITSGGPLSPTTSHPSNTQGDTATWAAGVSASNAPASNTGPSLGSFWGTGSIWNSDPARKSPPKQLNSGSQQTINGPIPSANPLFAGSEALPSPTAMPNNNGEFPIPIPLQPQFRNYRSMSFSVGQMDLEDQSRPRLSPPAAMFSGSRQPGLQHRPSRPSLLSGEQFAESPLRSVFETEDEENGKFAEASNGPTSYFQSHNSGYSRVKYEPTSFRGRSASAATIPVMHLGASGLVLGKDDRIDEYESALAEEDDQDYGQFQQERRFSEAPRTMGAMYQAGAENQRLGDLRQTWQSGGMFSIGDSGTQSRRHSFAGLGAEFAGTDLLGKRIPGAGENGIGLGNREYPNENNRLQSRQTFPLKTTAMGQPLAPQQNHHHLQQQLPVYASNSRTSPPPNTHRGMMLPMHAQPRSQQLLYFVTFKACRGDVFYVQEGTGLRVRVGDLVIVEADRGTDLGTVIADNISWQQAKDLKEQYAKEQYNVLMMYASRRAGVPGAPSAAGTGSLNGNMNGNSTGAMSGHGQVQAQDTQVADLKPKMIKRLAQPHEIQTLRDKEANEAKAKRVCQQKVLEHRLPMEILDAEFQMDWKKLTFYYFADSYINFNSLVTDLFKVYKTRIWMSAMNPASFAHPTGLHPPGSGIPTSSGLGPIGEASNETLHTQYGGQTQPYPSYGSGTASGLMGGGQRGSSQHSGVTGFPSRHSPSAADFVPQNGYAQYLNNGLSGLPTQQNPFGLGDGHSNGANDMSQTWMGLQGLSLGSH